MIAHAGVTVEVPHCAEVARALAEYVRARGSSPELERLIGELEEMSARTSDAVRSLDRGLDWVPTSLAASRLGVSDRTVRRRARARAVPAKRERTETDG
jgi:hypothetical protein